ncbi:hypothetical protein C3747_74g174 [Trypanosoma cruzi]|uniref:Uncharacterized protein n=1 Tax=Trypanosoma cruzi TaxID=5693 RepID=A0A2V2WNQ2_TRYCR|nr:hypothetical protein C3747_74g174 [Trypanosoma cruzi]
MCGLTTLLSVLFCREDWIRLPATFGIAMWPKRCLEGVERPQGTAFVFICGSVTGEEMRTFRHLASRCLLTPYLVSLWLLSGAPAFYWMIGTAEVWRTFATPSFSIFVARRVRDGFLLPHCMGCCKAILCATRLCGGCHAVEVFDVIEVPLDGWSGDLPAQVIIDGFTRPFELAVSLLYFYELTADIAEYIQVAAVLHTFKVLSSAPSTAAADRPVSLKDLGGGFVQFVPRPELLLPFLSARHAHSVNLLFSLQWEEWVMTNLGRRWHFLLHRWVIGQRRSMHQSFLRVGDRHSVAEKIWMGVHRDKIRALFPCLCRWNAMICPLL